MRHADIALYAAKGSGRAKSLIFRPQMQHEVRERAAMVSRARTAAVSGDVIAYYQPKVSLDTGALVGFEALLRWRDACGKIQTPGAIYAAFDDPEVADLLGKVMLDHLLDDLQRWTCGGLAYGSVAINAAPAELRRGAFAPRLIDALKASGLPDRAVEVEVTEGVFLGRGADEAKRAIHLLHQAGIPLSLDDFGTGFASLSHLRALPVDAIKIDRSFIAHIADADGDKAIVSAIVSLGHNLGIKVIAEGIETPAQAEVLRSFGCKYAQGYYFGIPTPAAGIPHLIRGWGRSEDDAILAARRGGFVLG
jgi:EAL domain-containing protein (putative c-di-GMP-specific phosphodiesterase class I)